MHLLHNHLFIDTVYSDKQISFVCKEGHFLLPDADVLVYWKQQVQRMRSSQIGDGMSLVVTYPKPPVGELDLTALQLGLSIYQEYDEQTNKRTTYLYKYTGDTDEKDRLNTLFATYGLGCSLARTGSFVRLEGAERIDVEEIGNLTTHTQICSFLLGVALGYGKPKHLVDRTVYSRHIGIPLIGTLVHVVEQMTHMLSHMHTTGLFVGCSEQKGAHGNVLQITVRDPDLLEFFRVHGGYDIENTVSYEHLRDTIVSLVGENRSGDDSVLKLLTK